MNRFWIGPVLLAVVLAVCILSVNLLAGYTEEAAVALEQAQQQVERGDYDAAGDTARQAYARWRGHSGTIGVILLHEENDSIEQEFGVLLVCARQGHMDEFERSCARLISMLRQTSDMERLRYYNLL